MTSKENKHQKHAKLERPNYGEFGRNEWSIIGTPCGNLKSIAAQLVEILSAEYQTAYVDADHHAKEDPDSAGSLKAGALLEYTDKITHHRFDQKGALNRHSYRPYFNEQDLVIVNGNHFTAKHQIVVIDERKLESLSRKLDRLTDVHLILMEGDSTDLPEFLKQHLADKPMPPILRSTDLTQIAAFIQAKMKANISPVYGLVLAGGKSQRMGQDKGLIDYHGKPQREFMADLLSNFCAKTFLSCRPEQQETINSEYALLPDQFLGLGPMGAILSAFCKHPNHSWLVVACDLPLLDKATLDFLLTNRNPSKIATTYQSPVTDFPEPLVTVWEPKSYPIVLQFLAQGYSCPRKVLINSDVNVLPVADARCLLNVNRPEELAEVRKSLNL